MKLQLPIGSLLTHRPTRSGSRRGALALLLLALFACVAGRWWWQRETVRRSHRFDAIIWESGERHRVSPFLIKAIVRQESNFRPGVVGNAGEVGLMQVTTGAVRDWERKTGQRCPAPGMLFDPRVNIEIGSWYVAAALERWATHPDRDVLALAQYNAGIGNVLKWQAIAGSGDALERVRFPTTREYIRHVTDYRETYEHEYHNTP